MCVMNFKMQTFSTLGIIYCKVKYQLIKIKLIKVVYMETVSEHEKRHN